MTAQITAASTEKGMTARTMELIDRSARAFHSRQSLRENRAVIRRLDQRPLRGPVGVVFDRGRVRAVDVHGGHPDPGRRDSIS